MKTIAIAAVLLIASLAGFAADTAGVKTDSLTAVVSERQGNTWTWTIINNSGPLDGRDGWDVLIWAVVPEGLPDPVMTEAPMGWEWSAGQGRFQIANAREKYSSKPAIGPGASAIFRYSVDPSVKDLQDPSFQIHVGAVKPEPTAVDGVAVWTATVVEGNASWFDRPQVRQDTVAETSEPAGFAAGLMWFAGTVGLINRGRRARKSMVKR